MKIGHRQYICTECNKRPLSGDLLRNSKGHGMGMYCAECHAEGVKLVNTIAGLHGAYIVDGRYISSPRGTPNVRSLKEARAYIAAQRSERACA